jgi:hypothetical protein
MSLISAGSISLDSSFNLIPSTSTSNKTPFAVDMTHKRRTEEYEISMDCPFKQRVRRRRPAGGTYMYSEGET